MNIVMVGGRKKIDFLAKSLLEKKHHITLIHDDENYCKYLSRTHNAPVVFGDGSKPYILEDANIGGADVIIALTPKDADNLVICQLAKKVYGVKRAFTTVSNPKNVEVFKKLGINSVISATYIVAGIIEQMAAINEIENFISIEQGKIVMMEIVVRENYPVCGKTLAEIGFPEQGIVGCIIRGVNSIIPRGKTRIQADDKLIILSPPKIQRELIELIVGRDDI
ncbi:trk system potassium uptake protein TrkA [Anaerobacterium chartisolvens]|uniref:Trk system potassium uptake protein TrkA n=1 Tax=Anaerobacterium chartisolvens TaxID=1297424 RepID=A0A369AYV8_9FIRM|nr:TrkA family potassium uptake protein [Anaerobacterium chartisolvens]RCX14343.1 trk system potassium uptake protein TrkA [Anaerobacterium chartisolvens]